MSRSREVSTEEQRRLDAHRAEMDASPLSAAEVQLWLGSLGTLDDAVDKAEQLRICRELLRNAPDDDMLDSDQRIIKESIASLEEELARAPIAKPIAHRRARIAADDDSIFSDDETIGSDTDDRIIDPFDPDELPD